MFAFESLTDLIQENKGEVSSHKQYSIYLPIRRLTFSFFYENIDNASFYAYLKPRFSFDVLVVFINQVFRDSKAQHQ